MNESSPFSFNEFPEDVQLYILSCLNPQEISIFGCTSKQYSLICRDDQRLWFSMCHRKFGSNTNIAKWSLEGISYKQLYKTLQEFDNIIGFWRLSCPPSQGHIPSTILPPSLVLFEWGPFYIIGFKIAPLEKGSYGVKKVPFLFGGLDDKGGDLYYVDHEGSVELSGEFGSWEELGSLESDLVRVDVSFIGRNHIVVEEFSRSSNSPGSEGGRRGMSRVGSSMNVREEEGSEEVYGSPGSGGGILDVSMLDIYQKFANSTSPGNGSWRRQRRRERERIGRRKWESQHFVKIVNCSPTPAHPLQGLWKGICEDMTLAFYLVAYDDIGGIACRRIGNSSGSSSGHTPVFWASSTTLTEFPFSAVEEHIYNSRMHVQPLMESEFSYEDLPPSEINDVSRMLNITSNYDLVIADLAAGRSSNSQQVEGRIWQYGNGMFGFGFMWNNYIIDLKHITQDGFLYSVGLPTS
ncbi:hypothetical protein LIER_02007 [Lithospermum erythrorhizon]|uniref:F-box domain-containing protein n=1 Tax=Lithospermum erythrorhizon TaxID=34254 RepID=A0AAV3NQD8_LITER